MSWTDQDIDKLFQNSAGKSSFEYKPEYWEEFAASLPINPSVANMSDAEVDALFQKEAEKGTIAYKPEYWEEFAATLPITPSVAEMSDAEMDALFQKDAEKSAVAYKPEYWEEFAATLPIIVPTEEVSDSEVDALYQESASQLSFKYKNTYWEEMAAILSRRRRPDFLWFGFSGLFVAALIYGMFSPQTQLGTDIDFVSEIPQELNLTANHTFTAQNENPKSSNSINGATIGTKNDSSAETNKPISPNNDLLNNSNLANEGSISVNAQRSDVSLNDENNPNKETGLLKKKQSPSSLRSNQEIVSPKVLTVTFDNELSELSPRTLQTKEEAGERAPWTPRNVKNDVLFGMYVQGLGGISQSSITPSPFTSNSLGIGAGVLINKRNWTIGLGTNVIVENYKDLLLTRTAKVYGFGSDLYKYDLLYKQLYVAELDLSIGYNLGSHRLNVGLRPSFAFSSQVDIDETSITSSQGQMVENTESRTSVYGFMEGVRQFGVKPMIGYAYTFRGNWTLGANFGVELMPAINEEFINGANNKLPFDGQLYLRKNLNLK